MLYGQKELVVDEKSRLTMPSLYKEEFKLDSDTYFCYVTLGMDGCVDIYSKDTFEKNIATVNALSNFDPKAREFKRTYMANTFSLEIDSHSRLLLPKVLLEKAKINKNVTLVGLYDHLELWDSETFNKSQLEGEKNFSTDAEKILEKNYGSAI